MLERAISGLDPEFVFFAEVYRSGLMLSHEARRWCTLAVQYTALQQRTAAAGRGSPLKRPSSALNPISG